ncbi:hypothetical protein C8J57DRAFT_1529977 [Mycena rebaudengoi]|nr:hypothetical protein C8J57DRAFT_1529977 [Mycena rebaudengoi]
MGDFAYDWVVAYLENHRVWNESRSFKVVARNPMSRPSQHSTLGKSDGHPHPIYEPATAQRPYSVGGVIGCQSLWSRNRQNLDDFVSAARDFYVESQALPRKQLDFKHEQSGSLLTAFFEKSDLAYDWMLEYLRSAEALKYTMSYTFLFQSHTTKLSTWLQVSVDTGLSWEPGKSFGGSITIVLHSSDKSVLEDLVECARQQYEDTGASRVTVHLTDSNGTWAKTVTKSRRALSTLILPSQIKETLLADAQEFLASVTPVEFRTVEDIYYGAPGTGKSSTIHAIAGELGLEIYFISLASPAEQMENLGGNDEGRLDTPTLLFTAVELDQYASEFAAAIPSEMYSITQVQGYLLMHKHNPLGAVQGVAEWLTAQHMERLAMSESKRRWKEEVARWRGEFDAPRPLRGVDAWELVVGTMEQQEKLPVDEPSGTGGSPVHDSAVEVAGGEGVGIEGDC